MTNTLAAEREAVRGAVADLEGIRYRLLGVKGTLKEPEAEKVRDMDLEELDAGTELRAVISCVLNDSIEPAIRDLQDVLKAIEEQAEAEENSR